MYNKPLLITLFILFVGHFLVDFMIGLWPIYKTLVNMDLAFAGLLAGICAFMGEGMQLIFGSLSDRGYRKALILSGVILTMAGAFYAYTDNLLLLTLFLFLTCAGSAAFHPSAVGMIGSLPSHRKALLVSIFATGGSLGMASSQFIFSRIFEYLSGHTVILVIPALLLFGLTLFYKFSGVAHATGNHPTKHIDFKLYVRTLRNRDVGFLFISQVCNQTFMWSMNFLLSDLLIARGYSDWLTYGGGYFCFIVGGAIMMIPSGYLADKYSSKTVIITASTLGLGFFYLFLFDGGLPAPVIGALLFMIGACLWIIMPISVAFGNQLIPSNPGVVSAILMGLVWCISESLGPAGAGLLTKLFNEDAAASSLACVSLLLAVGVFAAARLPKKIFHPETVAVPVESID
jgi:FSR family fosmidomycin resistance protein-like MFS transporter